MPAFVPQRICPPYDFDIKRNRQGYWVARDRDGLAGGTFLTCKDAVRFALFETGGDSAHVHTDPGPGLTASMAPGPTGGLGRYSEHLVPECRVSSRRSHPPFFAEPRPRWDVEIGWRERCLRWQLS